MRVPTPFWLIAAGLSRVRTSYANITISQGCTRIHKGHGRASPMSLRYALLSLLLDGDATGYDLARRFDASVANFWHALPQQLYQELARMEDDGLVRGKAVVQAARPNKRVFSDWNSWSVSAAGLRRIRSSIPIFPTSCSKAEIRIFSTSSSGRFISSAIVCE